MPASLCGVVGLKPSYGRVSKPGVLPLSYAFDHAGPIARTRRRRRAHAERDRGLRRRRRDQRARARGRRARRSSARACAGCASACRARGSSSASTRKSARRIESALRELARLGAEVRDVPLPGVGEAVGGIFGFVLAEAQEIHAESLRTRPQDFGADVRALLESRAPDTAALMVGLRARDALVVAMRSALEAVDVLVTPTTPIPATTIGQESVRYGGVEESVLAALIRCTAPFNATHLPALSLPCGFTRAGLPIGLQIAGRPFDEATVLRVGHAYEQATDWHTRTPAL